MTGSAMNGANTDCTSSWLELESDPGLFTLLVDDFGVQGIQVEEIYDLSKPLDNSTLGFIFLFKWIERRNGRRGKTSGPDSTSNYVTDPTIINNMFFAHQIVPNSCATHALLSVLLNSRASKSFQLGDLLNNFKCLCQGLSPEMKGLAIGNQPRLAQAHNSYAKPETSVRKASSSMPSSSSSSNLTASMSSSSLVAPNGAPQIHSTMSNEIFHFICFVPINGKLFELDGLKPYPIDHGAIQAASCNLKLIDELLQAQRSDLKSTLFNLYQNYRHDSLNWSDKFKKIILHRLNSHGQQNHEIRFNLMAVVGDNMLKYKNQLLVLERNRRLLLNTLNGENELRTEDANEDVGDVCRLRNERKEIFFDLKSHDLVASLVEDVEKNEKIESAEFVHNLCKLVQKFGLVEICKVFQVSEDGVCECVVKKSASISELREIETELGTEIESLQAKYNEEVDKRKRYATEAFRRKHVYNEFIVSYLKVLAENGKLEEIVRNSVTNKSGSGNGGDSKLAASSFFISPDSLFIQQNSNKKLRKK